jgi:hypothetical protein
MKPLSKFLLAICILGLVLGLADVGNAMFSGLARAIGAAFFILFFITRALEFASAEEAVEANSPAPASEPVAAPRDLASHGHAA